MIATYVTCDITHTISYDWNVYNTDGSGYSILDFTNRLKIYLNSGLFGLKKGFGLNLICFFIILITTGIFSYKYGLDNTFIISLIAIVQLFILEIVLGLMETSIGNIPLTAWSLIVLLITGLREWNR
jgi:hypothetical protein